MADVILKNIDGSPATYKNVNPVVLTSTTGEAVVYSEGGSGGGVAVQADYAQNIETEMDYIKNRPFYDNRTSLLAYQEYNCNVIGAGENDISAMISMSILDPSFVIEPHKTYTVAFNGVEYICTCRLINDSYILGNVYKYLLYAGITEITTDQTNEPFAFGYTVAKDDGSKIGMVMFFDQTEEITCQLGIDNGQLKKIDQKYLSDIKWEDIKNRPFYDELKVIHDKQNILFQSDNGVYIGSPDVSVDTLLEGDTVVVSWNGTDYTCVIENFDLGLGESMLVAGNVDFFITAQPDATKEPFALGYMTLSDETTSANMVMYVDCTEVTDLEDITSTKVINVGLSKPGKVVQIDEKYIPDTKWEDIEDKPFYDNTKVDMYSFETTPTVSFDLMDFTWWKVYDAHPTAEELTKLKVVYEHNGSRYSNTPKISEVLLETDDFAVMQMDLNLEFFKYASSNTANVGFASVHTAGVVQFEYMGMSLSVDFPETGLYFAYAQGSTVPSSVKFGIERSDIKPIDLKYISNLLPAYDTRTTITFDGNLTDKETIQIENGFLVKVRDNGIDRNNFIGATSRAAFVAGDTLVEADPVTIKTLYEPLDGLSIYTENDIPLIVSVNTDTVSFSGLTATRGLYFAYMQGTWEDDEVNVCMCELSYGEFKKLDEKFLPDNIGGLPSVTEADNGKILQVVDGAWALVSIVDGNEVVY